MTDGVTLKRNEDGDLFWEDIATGDARLTVLFYPPWDALTNEQKLRLLTALVASAAADSQKEQP